MNIADLHCDLLSYCVDAPERTAFDSVSRCSLPQLQSGKVSCQVLAVFTSTEKGSVEFAEKQTEYFLKILRENTTSCRQIISANDFKQATYEEKVGISLAIENASGLCEEDEPLALCFSRLENILQKTQDIFYIGLTHHRENRFGGGNQTAVGLKSDGKILLDYLSGRGIAIDLAHTSRALAADILNYTAAANLSVPILDSHSNFFALKAHERNQTDEIALEIAARGGVIGLNFLKDYIGDHHKALLGHMEYAQKLGLEQNIAFGADFFYVEDAKDSPRYPYYFPEIFTAEAYPALLSEMSAAGFSEDFLKKIAFENAIAFLERKNCNR
jgi:microsomal dipeptidase-like Zn-dependent dipeptidase